MPLKLQKILLQRLKQLISDWAPMAAQLPVNHQALQQLKPLQMQSLI